MGSMVINDVAARGRRARGGVETDFPVCSGHGGAGGGRGGAKVEPQYMSLQPIPRHGLYSIGIGTTLSTRSNPGPTAPLTPPSIDS